MYQALYLVEKKFPYVKAGFMHIPYMIEHGDQDLKLVGGETH